jgi:proline iminopeptidase
VPFVGELPAAARHRGYVEGAQLRVENNRLCTRPTIVALHGGPGFDQAYLRPDLGGLVLCNTAATLAGEPDPDAPTLLCRAGSEAAAVAARLFGGDMSAETTAAFERLVAPHYAAPGHEDVPARLFPLSPLNPEIARHFFAELAPAYDLRPRLGEVTVPTLVVSGEHDWVCPPAAARTLAAGLPHATLCVLPDSGHFTFAEQPEPFRAALAGFLTRACPVE